MRDITKILAFISLFAILIMFTGAVSAANYAGDPQSSIQAIINNVSDNDTIMVKYTTGSSNTPTKNLNRDISQKNTTGIVMATTNYNCGPAALATVLNKMGINTTQDELAAIAGTNETGTTMYGLIQATQAKGLIAKGMKLSVDQLRPNNIVFLTINGEGHYSTIKNITNKTVYLADTSLGNINMTLADFKVAYSGDTLVITNNTNDIQLTSSTELTNEEMQKIIGKRYDVDWPRTGVKLAGCAMIAFGVVTLDPLPVIGGIATVSSAYVR